MTLFLYTSLIYGHALGKPAASPTIKDGRIGRRLSDSYAGITGMEYDMDLLEQTGISVVGVGGVGLPGRRTRLWAH